MPPHRRLPRSIYRRNRQHPAHPFRPSAPGSLPLIGVSRPVLDPGLRGRVTNSLVIPTEAFRPKRRNLRLLRREPQVLRLGMIIVGKACYFLSLRARFLIQIGVPTKPNAARIWFSRKR